MSLVFLYIKKWVSMCRVSKQQTTTSDYSFHRNIEKCEYAFAMQQKLPLFFQKGP